MAKFSSLFALVYISVAGSLTGMVNGELQQVMKQGDRLRLGFKKTFQNGKCRVIMKARGSLVVLKRTSEKKLMWQTGPAPGHVSGDIYVLMLITSGNMVMKRIVPPDDGPGKKVTVYDTNKVGDVGDYFLGINHDCVLEIHKGTVNEPGDLVWTNIKTNMKPPKSGPSVPPKPPKSGPLVPPKPPKSGHSVPPNIIFILSDDLGYGDLAAYGHPYANTPNLNKLAAEGSLFHRFYATGSVCNPSRTGFMTGRNPNSFPNYSADYGFRGATTVTELLQKTHKIGHFGKWHIGPDQSEGTYGIHEVDTSGDVFSSPRGKDSVVFDNAIKFITKNKDKPFYVNIWGRATHKPVDPSQRLINRSGFADLVIDRKKFGKHMQKKFDIAGKGGSDLSKHMANYLAEVFGFDALVGKLLQKVDDLGLRDNTIIVYSSDQGAAPAGNKNDMLRNMLGYAGGLRGGKHEFFEGGVRIPLIVRYPGVVPAGKVNERSVMSGMDWLPTVCSLSGVRYDKAMFEGEDVSDIWRGSDRSRINPIYWVNARRKAIVYGKWKLFYVKNQNRYELYDLEADPGEFKNVAGSNEVIVNALKQRLTDAMDKNFIVQRRGRKKPVFFDPNAPVPIIGPPDFKF